MKQTFRPILTGLTLLALIFSAPGPVAAASVADLAQAQKTSPEELLNADGTLNLNGTFQGALDLAGWNVQIDPERGPIFAPELAAPGQWANAEMGSNGSIKDWVQAIAVSGTDVYVGGWFKNVNNNGTVLTAADYIAKWNGSTWSSLSSNGAGDGSLNEPVHAIAISGTDVYVGGRFTDVNDNGTILTAADKIAKWDGSAWSAIGSNGAGDGSFNGIITALTVSGANLYVGGNFMDVNNNGVILTAADKIAKWDGSAWSALGSNGAGDGSLNNGVRAVAVSGANVYVGGYFTDVNNNGTLLPAADYIAKWDGSAWSALGSNGAGDGSINGVVLAIAVSGTKLYVGGSFTDVNNNGTILKAADNIVRWNGSDWSALGSNGAGNGSLNGYVSAIAISGTDIYVGGYFTNVNNQGTVLTAADKVAKWDGTKWSALGSNGAGDGSLNLAVNAVAVSGSNVYVGGGFTDVNNNGAILRAADAIAKWNGSTWSALGSNGFGNGSIRGFVSAIAVSGTDVYVGGGFLNVNNNGTSLPAADYIVKWNGSAWSALGSNGAGNGSINNGTVYAIAVHGTNIYVGGDFTNVNNNGTLLPAADYIAKWNGTAWSALGSNGAGNGSIPKNTPLITVVDAIAVSGKNLFVGGFFRNVNNNGVSLPAADSMAVYGLGAAPTATRTPTQTVGASPSPSPSVSPTETMTATVTLTEIPTETPTATPSPSPTGTMTETPTETATETPTETETPTVTPTP